ncbi:MAG TPA: F0F1 ATP synthase subunit A [Patescibacteria group bacterium]|nr:F0F1 ATP synthase subunit A [Patescibacteria group bacterium]
MKKTLHISVSPEPVMHIGDLQITNSTITSFLVILILFALVLLIKIKGKKDKSGLPFIVRFIFTGFYDFLKNIAREKVDILFPVLTTFFIYIIFSNWIGLLPGVGPIGIWEHLGDEKLLVPLFRSPNADLSTTFALAIVSVVTIQVMSIKSLGVKKYFMKFINISNPIKFFVGILELISEISKVLSFSFRLFGNVFAGEVLLLVMTFLIPLVVPVPFLILEIFVGFIQALVFTMLTTIFIVVSTEEHH